MRCICLALLAGHSLCNCNAPLYGFHKDRLRPKKDMEVHTGLKYMYSLWKNDKIHIDIMEYTSEMALFSRVRKLWFIEYM